MELTNPPLIIDGVPQSFLELGDPIFDVYTELDPPISLTDFLESDTFVSSKSDKVDRTHLTDNYPNTYSDTYSLHSGQGFIFKTGPAWPKGQVPYGRPLPHELCPINAHPITPVWDDILTCIETCLQEDKLPFTAVMPLAFATVGDREPFCPLVMAIGVEPTKVAFKDAKTVAESVRLILVKVGFDDVDVTIWEFETFLSSLNLPALDPVLHSNLTKFHHPFASTLGIPVAPLKQPKCEGTLGLFLTRSDGTELLALTAAHVACPPSTFSDNKDIQCKVRNFKNSIPAGQMSIPSLQTRLDNGEANVDGRIRTAIRTAQRQETICKQSIRKLYKLYSWVTLKMPIPSNCCIGRVVFADPIGTSSNGPDAFTLDWALIAIRKDAFGANFIGNTMFVGMRTEDKLEEQTFLDLMFPHPNDRQGYEYPEWGLLHISGIVPMDEIRYPKQLNEMGEPAMAVIKNRRSTDTTIGYVSSLKSLVHYSCKDTDLQFTSRDLTVVPYGGDPLGSAGFSSEGDLGSVIVERSGRVVGLLTAGGGRSGATDSTDVSFATAYCELEKRIKEVFPGIRLLN